ncbi:TetR/AcrR family transcriptional regulator [Paenibacillus cremeus]|nr:TetR/AcrR family transcriptional regulator [Paenibacillus cremeus]
MEDSVRLRIMRGAADMFNAKGYKSVTLSELATRLGMSKKTLYLYFSSKEDIAWAVIDMTLSAIAALVAEQKQRNGDPLSMLQETFQGIKQQIVKLNPLFLEDIQKFAPALWDQLEAFRGRQLEFIGGVLTKAMEAGLIREVNPRLVSAIILETIQRTVRPDFAAKQGVTMMDVADAWFDFILAGLRKPN